MEDFESKNKKFASDAVEVEPAEGLKEVDNVVSVTSYEDELNQQHF